MATLAGALRRIKLLRFLGKNPQEVFTGIYRNNGFGGTVSGSGSGSDLERTAELRKHLPSLISELNIKTLLDAPCGDFYWMKLVNLPVEKYCGVDIVESVIQHNQETYGNDSREFRVADLAKDPLPDADLIFCRDCLVHLNRSLAMSVLRNFARTNARYLLLTTFPNTTTNKEIITGSWRPLNLQLEPFNLPEPILLINERCDEQGSRYADKSMGLWSMDQLVGALKDS